MFKNSSHKRNANHSNYPECCYFGFEKMKNRERGGGGWGLLKALVSLTAQPLSQKITRLGKNKMACLTA